MDPQILDRCLAQIQTGQASLNDCLHEYPEHAAALEPMLQLAALANEQLQIEGPSASFRANAWKRTSNLLRAPARRPISDAAPTRIWSWRPAYTVASLLVTFALLVSSAGVAYASGEALPGDRLYGVKRGLEQVTLALSISNSGDKRLLLQHAERRLEEVQQLVGQGRQVDLAAALDGYESAISEALDLSAPGSAGLDNFESALQKHEQVLLGVMEQAHDSALPGLQQALEASQHGTLVIEQIRSGGSPNDLAPGQLRKTPEAESDEGPPGQLKRTPGSEPSQTEYPPGQLKKTPEPDE